MKKLGISELRPGPSGNPEAPNAANSDEAKAKTYHSLPELLVFDEGSPVKNAEEWPERRKEIQLHFDSQIYGKVPENLPDVTWEIVEEKDTLMGRYPVIYTHLLGHVDNSRFPDIEVGIEMTLVTPSNKNQAVPVMLEFGWNWPPGMEFPKSEGPAWQEQLLAKGWGYATLIPTSFQADNGAGLREGIIGLVNKGEPRDIDDWGTLRAWAWGAGRAMDYFEANPNVDETKVGIEGLSRYGKAAMVTMAYDSRFAIGFIGSSGAGGTKILRRNFGEQVENLVSSSQYHWFAPNFIKYAGPMTVNDLPVDAHHLVAMAAPRPIFISAGAGDVEGSWVDAKGMFSGGAFANPVYELLGYKGLPTQTFPPQGTNLAEGEIAFRQHEGGHTVIPNWPYFIEFAERYFSN
ncbi:acetylxylan esterase [Salinimicrobium marinum]|uniref:Acetylxylan esterase n=2 Tax=Salinimicrobium marinum TaxID=680283 RepID=A0A918S6J3_9FLAO|nr:acetylxylan esterase [Salinimicrobium marinum]